MGMFQGRWVRIEGPEDTGERRECEVLRDRTCRVDGRPVYRLDAVAIGRRPDELLLHKSEIGVKGSKGKTHEVLTIEKDGRLRGYLKPHASNTLTYLRPPDVGSSGTTGVRSHGRENEMASGKRDKKELQVGRDAVVMGDVSGSVGDGSVVIGATDSRGNVVLNQPMAVGRGAKAGPGSIAIGAGAGAGAGFDIVQALSEIQKIVQSTSDPELIQRVAELRSEAESEKRDRSRIQRLWSGVKGAAPLATWAHLVVRISEWVGNLS